MKRLSDLYKYPPLVAPDPTPEFVVNKGVLENATLKAQELVDHACYMGVEVEVENVPRGGFPVLSSFWNITEDNSLRNRGFEYITYPLNGVNLVAALQTFFAALPREAHFSQRTSIHVHMNVRDLATEQLTTLAVTYLALEKVLYGFVGKDRDKNIFCVPLGETRIAETLFQKLNRLKGRVEHVQDESLRYSGLNFGPLFKFGTIEFRQMAGTRDFNKVFTWVNLIQCLRKYATEHTLDETLKLIVNLNTNSEYKAFAIAVFGRYFYAIPEVIDTDIETGVRVVKRSIVNNKLKTHLISLAGGGVMNPLIVSRWKTLKDESVPFLDVRDGIPIARRPRLEVGPGDVLAPAPARAVRWEEIAVNPQNQRGLR